MKLKEDTKYIFRTSTGSHLAIYKGMEWNPYTDKFEILLQNPETGDTATVHPDEIRGISEESFSNSAWVAGASHHNRFDLA